MVTVLTLQIVLALIDRHLSKSQQHVSKKSYVFTEGKGEN